MPGGTGLDDVAAWWSEIEVETATGVRTWSSCASAMMATMALFLAGGGSVKDESLVWQAAFDGVSRVHYWPFALPAERVKDAERWLRTSLNELAIQVEVITWETTQSRNLEVGEADLLFVGGGLTSRLASALRRAGLIEPIRHLLAEGGRYYGGSAGALLPSERITLAAMLADDPAAQDMPGLGVLRGPVVMPHANRYPDATPHEAAEALGHPVLAIAETSGVVVDGQRFKVLGHDTVRLARGGDVVTLPPGAVEDF